MWDSVQQIVRIILYMGAGFLVNQGIIDESVVDSLAGGVLAVITGFWTVYWNKNRPEAA